MELSRTKLILFLNLISFSDNLYSKLYPFKKNQSFATNVIVSNLRIDSKLSPLVLHSNSRPFKTFIFLIQTSFPASPVKPASYRSYYGRSYVHTLQRSYIRRSEKERKKHILLLLVQLQNLQPSFHCVHGKKAPTVE